MCALLNYQKQNNSMRILFYGVGTLKTRREIKVPLCSELETVTLEAYPNFSDYLKNSY